MNKLVILCCDGLDYEEMVKYDIGLYHNRLVIPKECYYEGVPYTPDIWGSFFIGDVWLHPDRDMFGHKMTLRLKFRKLLKSVGISWVRRGWKFSLKEDDVRFLDFVASNKVVSPLARPNILDGYVSFDYRIPSVSHGFYFGSESSVRDFHIVFMNFLKVVNMFNYQVFAIYTNLFDHLGHRGIKQVDYYEDLMFWIKNIGGDVVVLSDHATRDLEHKDYAYCGCSWECDVSNVINVRSLLESRLNE